MNEFRWNFQKNIELKKTRDVTFDELINANLVDVLRHPKRKQQQLLLVEFKKYVWVIPYVKGNGYLFLKTAFPSRKYTREYLGDL